HQPLRSVDLESVFHTTSLILSSFFFFHDPPPNYIYTLSLHDALPIFRRAAAGRARRVQQDHRGLAQHDLRSPPAAPAGIRGGHRSEEHTLNSSHVAISYAVFCLKKKIKFRMT